MSEQVFHDRPHVELLQWLARGSLKQNLLRAIRLWVLLRFLYGVSPRRSGLDDGFTYAQWRDAFFSATHPKGEAQPARHDPGCACAKTVAEWVFEPGTGVIEAEWRQALWQHDAIADAVLDPLLQQRLFGVTRRSLLGDLQVLTELGWLNRAGQGYRRVKTFPAYPVGKTIGGATARLNAYALNFLQPDLAQIAQNFAQAIGGGQRFFLHLDYILSPAVLDRVDDWQEQFRHLWSQQTVPVQLSYASARVKRLVRCIVYPVCIYYVQRAVYLCGFGQTPTRQGHWYNYRLDRIESVLPLKWGDPGIPQMLLSHYQQSTLPSPEVIEIELSKAWGFDFYLPSCLMLLRFNRDFHDRYIDGTFRHDTFQRVTYKQAQRLVQQEATDPVERQQLLQILTARSPQDAYYQVMYRDGDTNVGQRLRAWRPNGEVVLPWKLRQTILQEVTTEFQLYSSEMKDESNSIDRTV